MAINRLDGQGLPERPEVQGKSTAKAAARTADKSEGRAAGPEAANHDGDRVELSREARRIADLRKAVADLPDVREARVAELRESLSRGTYRVDARELASAILKDPDAFVAE